MYFLWKPIDILHQILLYIDLYIISFPQYYEILSFFQISKILYNNDFCYPFCESYNYLYFFTSSVLRYTIENTSIQDFLSSYDYVITNAGGQLPTGTEVYYSEFLFKDYWFAIFLFFVIGSLIGGGIVVFFGILLKNLFKENSKVLQHINNNIIIYAILFRILPIIGPLSYVFLGLSNKKFLHKILYIIYSSIFVIIVSLVLNCIGHIPLYIEQNGVHNFIDIYYDEIAIFVFIIFSIIYKVIQRFINKSS